MKKKYEDAMAAVLQFWTDLWAQIQSN